MLQNFRVNFHTFTTLAALISFTALTSHTSRATPTSLIFFDKSEEIMDGATV